MTFQSVQMSTSLSRELGLQLEHIWFLRKKFVGAQRRYKVPAAPYSSTVFFLLALETAARYGMHRKDRAVCCWHIIIQLYMGIT